jgi:hypothetical protein
VPSADPADHDALQQRRAFARWAVAAVFAVVGRVRRELVLVGVELGQGDEAGMVVGDERDPLCSRPQLRAVLPLAVGLCW